MGPIVICFTSAMMLTNCHSATGLGSYAAYADQHSPYEVICAMDFASSAQVISTSHGGKRIYIIHATEQVRRLQYTLIIDIHLFW